MQHNTFPTTGEINQKSFYLVDLRADELLVPGVVLRRHEVLHHVDEQPEGVLLVHEEQRDRHDPVEALQQHEKCDK